MGWFDQQKQGNGNTGPRTPDGGKPNRAPGMPPKRTWLTFFLVLLANYMVVRYLFPGQEAPLIVPYTAFKQEVARGNVDSIYTKGESIEGRFAAPVTWPPPGSESALPARGEPRSRSDQLNRAPPRTATTFTTTLPVFVGPNFESFLIDNKVEISAVPIQSGGGWSTLLFGFGPAILLIAFYVWLFRRARQGAAA